MAGAVVLPGREARGGPQEAAAGPENMAAHGGAAVQQAVEPEGARPFTSPKIRTRQVIRSSPARPRGSAWAVRSIAPPVQAMPPVVQWLDAVHDAESNGRLQMLGNAVQTPTHWSNEGARFKGVGEGHEMEHLYVRSHAGHPSRREAGPAHAERMSRARHQRSACPCA